MEDRIGAFGLVLNALVLFNTRYINAALTQLRADGEVRDEGVARLSPFVRHYVNMLGRFSFQLPDLPGGLRPLRDKRLTASRHQQRCVGPRSAKVRWRCEGFRPPPPLRGRCCRQG